MVLNEDKQMSISVQDMCYFLSQFKDGNNSHKRGEDLHRKKVLVCALRDGLVQIDEDEDWPHRKSLSTTKKGRKYLRDHTGLRGFINFVLRD